MKQSFYLILLLMPISVLAWPNFYANPPQAQHTSAPTESANPQTDMPIAVDRCNTYRNLWQQVGTGANAHWIPVTNGSGVQISQPQAGEEKCRTLDLTP